MIYSTSVALCTYNGARFLQQQLDSLALQNILPSELRICDDASTDDTVGMLENFSKNVKFKVKIFKNLTNLGYVKNFERQTIKLRFTRMLKRIYRVAKGYSKRNFYAAIIFRINNSKFTLRHPNLIKLYKKYC